LNEFHLFSQLPVELRLDIWRLALPERVIEASLCFHGKLSFPACFFQSLLTTAVDGGWACAEQNSITSSDHSLHQHLPNISRVNSESRQFCMSEYVSFGHTYVHPTVDLLYITWYHNLPETHSNTGHKFHALQGMPFGRLHSVALTIGRNPSFETRFGALAACLVELGAPREVLLSLAGPNLPSVHQLSAGISISTGKSVVLLDWPHSSESNIAQEVRTQVIQSIEAEKVKLPNLNIPNISERLYYFYSEP
jgi:hypothetical protein